MTEPRAYRFADAQRPGVVLGLAPRQAVPIAAGLVAMAALLQSPAPAVVSGVAPLLGVLVAFGRWRGTPLTETIAPGARLALARLRGRHRWVHSLDGTESQMSLPPALAGLQMLDVTPDQRTRPIAVMHDRVTGTVTAVLRVAGHGFALASAPEQDTMLSSWAAALSPFARERCPVTAIAWHEWAHPVAASDHARFLVAAGLHQRSEAAAVADYLALVEQQAPSTVTHDVLLSLTVDIRLVRTRRTTTSRLASAIDTLQDELRLFASRLDAAGLAVGEPLTPSELAAAIRVRSHPAQAMQVATLTRSLAAMVGHRVVEWGPNVVEADWSHVRVDGAFHRAYRIAGWPRLPVGSDWMSELLTASRAIRTVSVVLEPVPMSKAARAADREVMSRESDAEMKTQKGFRINARERKRLADVETRERELSEGHAEFQYVGLVTVTAATLDELDDACSDIEQAAAQSLLDLRPLDARHDLGWAASLPVGRALARRPR